MNVLSSERQAAAQPGFMTGVSTAPGGQGFKKTFYKRQLPCPPSTAFASPEGRQLFAEAMASGHMNGFFKLMEQFSTQDDPAFCGLASLSMVLNALAIDPRRTWKGAWRWFHEQMLDCCRPLDDIKREGITLTQAVCLARCNGARVVLQRSGSFTLEQLRQQVMAACSSGEHHLVVSYTRRAFSQTGDGHFSPVGGYHAAKDLVLILDVARFKYPPHWVPLPLLFEAMKAVDPVTGLPRGYLHVSSQPLLSSILLTLDVRSSCWQEANQWVRATAPDMVRQASRAPHGPPPEQLLAGLLAALPMPSLDAFLMLRHNVVPQSSTPSNSAAAAAPSALSALSASLTQQLTGAGGGDRGPTQTAGGGDGSTPLQHPDGQHHQDGQHDHHQEPHLQAAAGSGSEAVDRCMPVAARQQLLVELRALPLFSVVHTLMSKSGQLSACTLLQCDHPDAHPHPQQGGGGDGGRGGGAGVGNCDATDETLDEADNAHRSHRTPAAGQGGAGPSACCTPGAGAATATASVSLAQASQAISGGGGAAGGAADGVAGKAASGCCQPPVDQEQLEAARGDGAAAAAEAAAAAAAAAAAQHAGGNSGYLAEKATMLLLLRGQEAWPTAWADEAAGKAWAALLDTTGMGVLQAELAFLREQWAHIDEVVQSDSVEPSCGSGCSVSLDCAALKCSTSTPAAGAAAGGQKQ